MILKQKQSKKFHIISIILGVILVGIGSKIYSFLYRHNTDGLSFENVVYMIVCIETIMFGVILFLINFENGWRRIISLVIVGFLIAGIIFNEQFRFGIILFVGTMIAYILTMRFKNLFSTITTISFCATFFLILTTVVLKLANGINARLLLYFMFSLFIVFYRVLGKRINQWFIARMLGFENESETYDDKQLKNQILLVYMIIFVFLNVSLYQEKIDGETWNLINNSFLTGLAIIQIDWNKIVFYFNKPSINEK